jgi:Tfp pilus assembly protein PilN
VVSLIRYLPWGLAALGVAAAGFLFWRLGEANQRIGALETERDALKATVEAKDAATRSRATIERRNRQLGPDAIIDKLR